MLDSRWYFMGESFASEEREYPYVGYNVYRTKDGRMLAFGFYERAFWNDFRADIARPDLLDTLKDTPSCNPTANEAVVQVVAKKTFDECIRWLAGKTTASRLC